MFNVLLIFLLFVVFILLAIVAKGHYCIRQLPSLNKLKTPYQQREYSRLGKELPDSNDIVTLDRLPLSLIQTIIGAEDWAFARHHGVHWRSTRKALKSLLIHRKDTGGGSTITQQLVKNLFFTFERSYKRKIIEIIWALILEKYWSKSTILEAYLNVIEYGEGVFGIQAAAKHYFHKNAWELTIDECVWLSTILPNPKRLSQKSNADFIRNRCSIYRKRLPFSDLSFLNPDNFNQRISTEFEDRLTVICGMAHQNPHFLAKRSIKVQGLMLHSVGHPNPNAKAFMRTQNRRKYSRACVHGFIDANNGNVYQTMGWKQRGAHAGGDANNTHLGIEMCEPASIRYTQGAQWIDLDYENTHRCVLFTYRKAVNLFAHLCLHLDLNPLTPGVIISHSEGHQLGIASDHKDVEHLWDHFGLTMDRFRQEVYETMQTKHDAIFIEYVTPEFAKARKLEEGL